MLSRVKGLTLTDLLCLFVEKTWEGFTVRLLTSLKRLCVISTLLVCLPLSAMSESMVRAAVLKVEREQPLPLSRLDLPPDDLGFAGGRLATADNATTGRFLKQTFETTEITVDPDGAAAALDQLIADGAHHVVLLADAQDVLALADHAKEKEVLLYNALAPDDVLRTDECRSNLVHVAPSRGMLADAVAQYLKWKQWNEWVLIYGSHERDRLSADAYRRAAAKFGAKIVEEREFEDTGGARRSDSGHVLVQKQIPVFSQDISDHEVVVIADDSQVFGAYIPYRTWTPRPVVGAAGLIPSSWHPAHEAWGATQVQRRFEKQSNRHMRAEDYQVWLALRSVGEAASRAGDVSFAAMRDYILSDKFELAAFKGQKLTFRSWNRQLRQPVLLADRKLVVTVSPQEGFLHQTSQLDTLGYDKPEVRCSTD